MALYVWGRNHSEQLGQRDGQSKHYTPVKVAALENEVLVDFAAGEHHSLAVNELGHVFAWGRGREGQLALAPTSSYDHLVSTPCQVEALDGEIITKVACGDSHSLALTASGDVFMWGLLPGSRQVWSDGVADQSSVSLAGMTFVPPNTSRPVGSVTDDGLKLETYRHACFVPRPCLALKNIVIINITAGFAHSLAVSSCGATFACGYNDNGQLGLGHQHNTAEFQRITALEGFQVEHIACGQQHSLACSRVDDNNEEDRTSGICFAWGFGVLGQLGIGGGKNSSLPLQVPIDQPVVSVAAGNHHSVAVTRDGQVYTWGHSEYGQHGSDQEFYDILRASRYFRPQVQETLASANVHVSKVTCSSHSTFAVTTTGEVYSWGWREFGILGRESYKLYKTKPQLVSGLHNAEGASVVHISAGASHCGVLMKREGYHYSLKYDKVLERGEFSDIEFIVGQEEPIKMRAHQVVVSARSTYISGLIRMHQLALTAENGKIEHANLTSKTLVMDDFHDVNADVFQAFLLFLYTDRVVIPSNKQNEFRDFAERVCHEELMIRCSSTWKQKSSNLNKKLIDSRDFTTDMDAMVLSKTLADVIFLWPINGKNEQVERLPAHKAVLCQIDYFRTMFSGRFSEGVKKRSKNLPGTVQELPLLSMEGDGVTLDSFKRSLRWIYTGSFALLNISDPSEMMDLYVAANLLGLTALAGLCEQHIATHLPWLEPSSLVACLDFAEHYNAQSLTRLARNVITKRKQESNIP